MRPFNSLTLGLSALSLAALGVAIWLRTFGTAGRLAGLALVLAVAIFAIRRVPRSPYRRDGASIRPK